jgi:hypothetical protein
LAAASAATLTAAGACAWLLADESGAGGKDSRPSPVASSVRKGQFASDDTGVTVEPRSNGESRALPPVSAKTGGAETAPTRPPPDSAVQDLLAAAQSGRIQILRHDPHEQVLDLTKPESAPLIVRSWAQQNLSEAISWVTALSESALKSACLQQLALVQAQQDPQATTEWAKNLPAGASRDAALDTLAWEISASDPMSALDVAIDLPASDARLRLLEHVAASWAGTDPAAAAAWAKAIDDPAVVAAVLDPIATALANRDPAGAADLVASDLPPGAEQARAATAVVQRWAQQDPTAAARWAASFPAGPTGEAVAANLVAQWSNSSESAPFQWLSTVVQPGIRDAGFAALARATAVSDPAFSARCLSLVSGNPKRF